jgi:serine/threonine-protein kinase RsbW
VTGAYPVLHVGSFGSEDPARSSRPWSRTFRGTPESVPEARTFRGTPESVPQARRFVAELLLGCPAREALMTCVSELSANAIAHTDSGNGGVFIVTVDLPRPGLARIAVTDEGSTSLPTLRPLPPADPIPTADPLDPPAGSVDLLAEGGRGLALVAACTTRWGYADAHPGRTVWAESCWPVPVPTAAEDVSRPGTRAKASRRSPSRWPRRRSPRPTLLPPGDRPPSPAA